MGAGTKLSTQGMAYVSESCMTMLSSARAARAMNFSGGFFRCPKVYTASPPDGKANACLRESQTGATACINVIEMGVGMTKSGRCISLGPCANTLGERTGNTADGQE